ncbi:MAG TPA: thiamine diphosphokinase [Candidatus Rifleibacterium sp.]|nr:thiamine diphosphokinase [Candidatus Rifleibacterium sp.]
MLNSGSCSSSAQIQPCSERAMVFFNGECDLPLDFFRKNSFYADFDVFAADGGANIALKYGICPSVVMGDMDSITSVNRRKLEKCSKFIVYPAEKEKSDGQLLLEFVIAQGYTDIHIFAATGGRIDQAFFNLHLLSDKPQCRVFTRTEEIFPVPSGSVISQRNGCRASLLPLTSTVKGLSLEGFRYNLESTDITSSSTLTLSNVIIAARAKVSYDDGNLLMVVTRKPEMRATRQPARLQLIKGKKQ